MRKLHLILLIITLLTAVVPAAADSKPGKKMLYEKYEKQLQTITSARDSVRILYYLFDLSDRRGQIELAWDIYHTAGRADNMTAQLDMLRNLGMFYAKNDSMTEKILALVEQVPNEISRAATKTYITNQHIGMKSRRPNDTEMQRMLLDSIKNSHNLEGGDIYDRISILYQIIQYLGVDSDGVLFKECLDRYAQIIDQLPSSDYPLKSQYYTTAAMIHSRLNGNPEKAIKFDRALLDIVDQLQVMYTKKGRTFRNYDTNKFISYRRMLSNYKGLTDDEIEALHDSILYFYEKDPDVKRTIETDGHADGFYHMAKGNYDKAIPYLQKMLSRPTISAYNKQKYNAMLMEASKATGNQSVYMAAMESYIHSSHVVDSLRRISMNREIMLRDSILSTPLLYKEPSTDRKSNRSNGPAYGNILLIVATILAILLIVYVTLYFRLRLKKLQ